MQFLVALNASAWELTHEEWYGPNVKGGADISAFSIPSAASAFAGTQNVFFDFDSATSVGEHVYTPAERDAIVAGVSAIYSPWDFVFSHTVVPVGTFARLIFNDGSAGGIASDIDFRNLDLGGSAQINVTPLIGLGASSATFVGISTTIGAHELGHLVGLRHADSFGPIGFGLAPLGPGRGPYLPDYPGLLTANESTRHTMSSPASVGQTIAEAVAGTHMGERSAVKLEFNEVGLVSPEIGISHSSPATSQALTLPTFPVPNTTGPGDLNFGKKLFADAEVVTAGISSFAENDWYKFSGTAGDIINAEVISNAPNRFIGSAIDPILTLFMPDGVTPVPHGFGSALNDDEFESLDSTLIDIGLPVSGTYYARVNSYSANDTGSYELYLFRFRTVNVPEPAALALLMLGLLWATVSARRSSLQV